MLMVRGVRKQIDGQSQRLEHTEADQDNMRKPPGGGIGPLEVGDVPKTADLAVLVGVEELQSVDLPGGVGQILLRRDNAKGPVQRKMALPTLWWIVLNQSSFYCSQNILKGRPVVFDNAFTPMCHVVKICFRGFDFSSR